jgi:hypothetical protein
MRIRNLFSPRSITWPTDRLFFGFFSTGLLSISSPITAYVLVSVTWVTWVTIGDFGDNPQASH